jgi:hypothetical protein
VAQGKQGLPHSKLEKEARDGTNGAAQAAPERGEEAAGAGGVRAYAEELRGNAEGAAKQVGVDAVEAGEPLERRILLLQRGIGEGDLILLRGAGFLLGFLASEVVGERGEAGGVTGLRDAIVGGLLEGIESARERALGLPGDGGLGLRGVAGIVEDVLVL